MSATAYLKFETLRSVRNRQAFIFAVVLPVLMYVLLAGGNRNEHNFGNVPGLFAPQYYMVSLLGYGAMIAVVSTGARIAAERTIGWNRQLRITPLTTRTYLGAKVAIGYLFAVTSMGLLYVLGASYGVRLSAGTWLLMSLLVLIALIPFAAFGIALGHLINVDAVGPAIGVGAFLLGFLGGVWYPIVGSGWFPTFCKLLPSYWLVQAGYVGLGASHNPWGIEGWFVIAFWSLAASAFAMWAYRRDTKRG